MILGVLVSLVVTTPLADPNRYTKARDRVFTPERLEQIEQQLLGVDRHTVLVELFKNVVGNATSNLDKHRRVLRFLHDAAVHDAKSQPLYEDGSMVQDPLVLLELGGMRCGMIARVGIDLLDAGGYKGRLVQLGGHQAAEIWYDNAWHYLDADVFSFGATVIVDGVIPSVAGLAAHQTALDALPAFTEPERDYGSPDPKPSAMYFTKAAYASKGPRFYIKHGNAADKYYGWMSYDTVLDGTRPLFDRPMQYRKR